MKPFRAARVSKRALLLAKEDNCARSLTLAALNGRVPA